MSITAVFKIYLFYTLIHTFLAGHLFYLRSTFIFKILIYIAFNLHVYLVFSIHISLVTNPMSNNPQLYSILF